MAIAMILPRLGSILEQLFVNGLGKSVGRLLATEISDSAVGNSLRLGLFRLTQQPFGNGVCILKDTGLEFRKNKVGLALILLGHLGARVVWRGLEGLEGSNSPTQIRVCVGAEGEKRTAQNM